jgi:hypothetical protein
MVDDPKRYWTRPSPIPRLDPKLERSPPGDAGAGTVRIDVSASGLRVPDPLRAMVVRCVLLALSRFGGRVRRVAVLLTQPANPLGGVDHRCRMRVRLASNDVLQVEAINGGVELAVGRAAARLGKRVAWTLDGLGSHGACAPPGPSGRIDGRRETTKRRSASRGRRRPRGR